MSHGTCPTLKIKSEHPSQGEYIEINASDYDASKHELYAGETAPAPAMAPPPPASAVNVKIDNDARQLAEDAGIELTTLVGTGKKGKITTQDVEAAIEKLGEQE